MTDTDALTAAKFEALALLASMPPPNWLVVSQHGRAVLALLERAWSEGWDRRRIKREARRAETSTYRRVGLA